MANLTFTLPDGIVVNAKSSKIKTESTIEKPAIIKKTEDGDPIRRVRVAVSHGGVTDEKSFGTFKWVVERQVPDTAQDGSQDPILRWEPLPEGVKVIDYAINPDTQELEPVKPFERTTQINLSWAMTLPATYAGQLLQESIYEIFGKTDVDTIKLCEMIDEAIEKDVMFMHEGMVWRKGYSQYHAVFIPNRTPEGKYSLIMMTTTGKAKLEHRMEPVQEDTAKEIVILPTLASLFV